MTVWVKNMKYISELHLKQFRLSAALFLNLKIMWGGLPSAVSVEHVAVSWAVTCALYNGKIWVNMAEPWTSVIFSPWKIKNCPWKVILIKPYEPCMNSVTPIMNKRQILANDNLLCFLVRHKNQTVASKSVSHAPAPQPHPVPPRPPSPIRAVKLEFQDQEIYKLEKFGKLLAGPNTDLGTCVLTSN